MKTKPEFRTRQKIGTFDFVTIDGFECEFVS